jgi:hypothetical protein
MTLEGAIGTYGRRYEVKASELVVRTFIVRGKDGACKSAIQVSWYLADKSNVVSTVERVTDWLLRWTKEGQG